MHKLKDIKSPMHIKHWSIIPKVDSSHLLGGKSTYNWKTVALKRQMRNATNKKEALKLKTDWVIVLIKFSLDLSINA